MAWSAANQLASEDADTSPLSLIHDPIVNDIGPGLDSAGKAEDAKWLRDRAAEFASDRLELRKLLLPLDALANVDAGKLEAFNPLLDALAADAKAAKEACDALKTADAPVGPLAARAAEWSQAVFNGATDRDPDPFSAVYTLRRIAVGIGALVPAQLASAAGALDQLAAALRAAGKSGDAIAAAAQQFRTHLVRLQADVRTLPVPAGERWAVQQNSFFTRALDVAFREMNLAAVSPVVVFDAARIGPRSDGVRYGVGPGVRFSIVTLDVTLGYSFNPKRRPGDPVGAFFFSMDIADLFR